MSEDQNEVVRPFETLELLAAILLGVAAIATALASYESSLYGGKSVENYSKANKIATSAGAERSRAIVEMARDSQVEMDAWRLTKEGDDAGNPAAEARNYEIATYLYTKVMSEPGYKASLGWSAAEPQVDSQKIMRARGAGGRAIAIISSGKQAHSVTDREAEPRELFFSSEVPLLSHKNVNAPDLKFAHRL